MTPEAREKMWQWLLDYQFELNCWSSVKMSLLARNVDAARLSRRRMKTATSVDARADDGGGSSTSI